MATSAWLERARQGDLEAYNQLIQTHQDEVFRLAYRLLCDERAAGVVVEQVFQRAFRELRSYRVGPLKNWLFSLLVRIYRQELANHNGKRNVKRSLKEAVEGSDQSVETCLAFLSPDQRLALSLVDLEGFDYNQAAAVAGWSVSTISGTLAQARYNFSQFLNGFEPVQITAS